MLKNELHNIKYSSYKNANKNYNPNNDKTSNIKSRNKENQINSSLSANPLLFKNNNKKLISEANWYRNKSNITFDGYFAKGNLDTTNKKILRNTSSVNYNLLSLTSENEHLKLSASESKRIYSNLKNKSSFDKGLRPLIQSESKTKKIIKFEPSFEILRHNLKSICKWDKEKGMENNNIFTIKNKNKEVLKVIKSSYDFHGTLPIKKSDLLKDLKNQNQKTNINLPTSVKHKSKLNRIIYNKSLNELEIQNKGKANFNNMLNNNRTKLTPEANLLNNVIFSNEFENNKFKRVKSRQLLSITQNNKDLGLIKEEKYDINNQNQIKKNHSSANFNTLKLQQHELKYKVEKSRDLLTHYSNLNKLKIDENSFDNKKKVSLRKTPPRLKVTGQIKKILQGNI